MLPLSEAATAKEASPWQCVVKQKAHSAGSANKSANDTWLCTSNQSKSTQSAAKPPVTKSSNNVDSDSSEQKKEAHNVEVETPREKNSGSKLGNDQVQIIADNTSVESNVAVASGKVVINYQNTELRADNIEFNQKNNIAVLKDDVLIKTVEENASESIVKATVFEGEDASFSLLENEGAINQASYLITHYKQQAVDKNASAPQCLPSTQTRLSETIEDNSIKRAASSQIRGQAESITLTNNKVSVTQGTYTRCTSNNPLWQVSAKHIELNDETGQGKVKRATVKIKSVPVLYLPYAQFPIGDQRQSGLLFPTIANGGGGLDITQPYYFNIAENLDATFAPRFREKTGFISGGQVRWLNKFDQWEFDGSYIDNDGDEESRFHDQSRWITNISETGLWWSSGFRSVTSDITYSEVSDVDYLRDLSNISVANQRGSHLGQRLQINYRDLLWDIGISANKYQTVDDNLSQDELPFETLPSAHISYIGIKKAYQLALDGQARYDQFSQDGQDASTRSYADLIAYYPLKIGGINITPAIGSEFLNYDLDEDYASSIAVPDSFSHTSTLASLRIETTFEKLNTNGSSSTIEPSLFWLKRNVSRDNDLSPLTQVSFDSAALDIEALTLDRIHRNAGYDLLEETDQLSASITHRRFSSNGHQQFAFSLGQIFYFEKANNISEVLDNAANSSTTAVVDSPASYSELVTSATLSPSHLWHTKIEAAWDHGSDLFNRAEANIYFQNPRQKTLFNLGYAYRRANTISSISQSKLEQGYVDIVQPINRSFTAISRYAYDLSLNEPTDIYGGLSYSSCCFKTSIVYRESLVYDPESANSVGDTNRGIFLFFEFTGLAGIGESAKELINESFFGAENLDF